MNPFKPYCAIWLKKSLTVPLVFTEITVVKPSDFLTVMLVFPAVYPLIVESLESPVSLTSFLVTFCSFELSLIQVEAVCCIQELPLPRVKPSEFLKSSDIPLM